MGALTVTPDEEESLRLREKSIPPPDRAAVLIQAFASGQSGTGREIDVGGDGQRPPGQDYMALCLEDPVSARDASPVSVPGGINLVVGVVRRSVPLPCKACAAGVWDMRWHKRYTGHLIKGLKGSARISGGKRRRHGPPRPSRLAPGQNRRPPRASHDYSH